MKKVGSLAALPFLLTLLLPSASTIAMAAPDHDRDDREHHRYYDRAHRDYHEWNDGEQRYWRDYHTTYHRPYREWERSSERERRAYWHWRHEQMEHRDARYGR